MASDLNFELRELQPYEASVVAALVAVCGEHAHRTAGLDHWYPLTKLDPLIDRLLDSDLFGVQVDDLLVGAFALSTRALPYYGDLSTFRIEASNPFYLSALAVLPSHQRSGAGSFAMRAAEQLTTGRGGDAIRFDAVTTNQPAVDFYDRLGYARAGIIPVGTLTVTCFERALDPGQG